MSNEQLPPHGGPHGQSGPGQNPGASSQDASQNSGAPQNREVPGWPQPALQNQGYPHQQPQPGRPGHPSAPHQATPYGAQQHPAGGYPAAGVNQQGQPHQNAAQPFATPGPQGSQSPKKIGLWIGLGAAALLLVLLALFLPALAKKGGSSPAAGGSESSAAADSGTPEEQAERALVDYYANLKDGKAQEAIKKLDTAYMSGFSASSPQYKDEFYSTVKNRPEGFTKSSVEKISDDYVKISGKVKQKGRDLDVDYVAKKIGGQWKLRSSKSSYLALPNVSGSYEGFPSIFRISQSP